MKPIAKALWFIESHFSTEIALEDIAKAGGVSRFHMTRAFGAATGRATGYYVGNWPSVRYLIVHRHCGLILRPQDLGC
jgi:transcriptional regulator GlxA family with amidase domain